MRSVLSAVAAVGAFALLVAGCGPGQQAESPPPTAPGTPEGEATLPDEEPNGQEPVVAQDIVVALGADGRVVVLDASTGEEARELLDGVRVDDPASTDVAVSADGDAAVVGMPSDEPSGDAEIVRVPLGGGAAETIAQGSMPAISPDGATLAYVGLAQRPEAEAVLPEPELVLRDLDSGEETRLSREQAFHFISDVEWTADGTQVVFTAGEIHTGLYALEADATSLDDARRLGPDVEQGGELSWGPVAAFGPDRLAVVETCCDVPREELWHVTAVDLADGTAHGALLPDDRVEATHLDSDAEAARLLIVVAGGPDGGALLRWDGDGDPEQIADGVIAAAW